MSGLETFYMLIHGDNSENNTNSSAMTFNTNEYSSDSYEDNKSAFPPNSFNKLSSNFKNDVIEKMNVNRSSHPNVKNQYKRRLEDLLELVEMEYKLLENDKKGESDDSNSTQAKPKLGRPPLDLPPQEKKAWQLHQRKINARNLRERRREEGPGEKKARGRPKLELNEQEMLDRKREQCRVAAKGYRDRMREKKKQRMLSSQGKNQ